MERKESIGKEEVPIPAYHKDEQRGEGDDECSSMGRRKDRQIVGEEGKE